MIADDRAFISRSDGAGWHYTESLFQSRFLADKLRSSHLYRLCTYLRNIEHNGEADSAAEGILLYPVSGRSIDQSYQMHGHRVSLRTLDLTQSWIGIEQQMFSVIRPASAG
jgi:5-methylcytosine-specific restriction enzyme subunit McrC